MAAASLNKIFFLGNLTRTPELKQVGNNQNVCKFGLASSRFVRSKNGEETQQEVCFVDITVWGLQAEHCKKMLDKGSSVLVEGRLKLESWTDQTGAKKSRHSIVADRVTFIKTAAQQGTTMEDQLFDKGEVDLESGSEAFPDELPF